MGEPPDALFNWNRQLKLPNPQPTFARPSFLLTGAHFPQKRPRVRCRDHVFCSMRSVFHSSHPFGCRWLGGGFENQSRPGASCGVSPGWRVPVFVASLSHKAQGRHRAETQTDSPSGAVLFHSISMPVPVVTSTSTVFGVVGERWCGIYVRHDFSIACADGGCSHARERARSPTEERQAGETVVRLAKTPQIR